MIWLGIVIIIATFYAIIKKYETRLVLVISGLAMALLSGQAFGAIDAFGKAMVNSTVVTITCTAMGFAFVIKHTECDQHMIHLITGALGEKFRSLLIPASIVITFCVNIAMTSAAGTAAAAGALLIPMMIKIGIHPVAAATAVFAGTWGNVFSLGSTHPAYIAKLAGSDVISVLEKQAGSVFAALGIIVIGVTLAVFLRKEHFGYSTEADVDVDNKRKFKVNYFKAIVPVVPLFMLVLASEQVAILPPINVPQAMIAGCLLTYAVSRKDAQGLSKKFFAGMGEAYTSIIGLIAAAAVFTFGMQAIGVTGGLLEAMKSSDHIAKIGAAFGPFIIAVLSGSGDAATLAFNGAITPHAADLGFDISKMGSQAFISGTLGRTMSPVAAAGIVCAQIAGVNPVELAKRTAPAMILATIVTMFILL